MNLKLFVLLISILIGYGWHSSIPLAVAQDIPPGDKKVLGSDTGQTSVPPADPTLVRGQGTATGTAPVEVRDPGTNNTPSPEYVRPRKPPNTADRSSGISQNVRMRLEDKEKYPTQSGSADVKWNTPCGSPKCLDAVSTKSGVNVYRSPVVNGAQGFKSIQGSTSLRAVQGRRR
jgi:hypothetical protein